MESRAGQTAGHGASPARLSTASREGTPLLAAGAAASAALALAWLGLSWWHPAVTYHFGPPLAAAAWPLVLRARLRQRVSGAGAPGAAAGGLIVAMAALAAAAEAHWLRGPTLIGHGSVPAEELLLALTASAWSWRVAARRRRAWFLPAEPARCRPSRRAWRDRGLIMGVADEVLAYVRTLVWPCVAVIALIFFRRQVAALIPRIREISAAGASVRFGERAASLADDAGRLVQGLAAGREGAAPRLPELTRPVPVSDPAAVFLEAYRELEASARAAGPAAEVAAATPVPVIRGLASHGQVPGEAVRIAEDLRRIRNEVTHGARRLEAVDAENLVITARSLAAICRVMAERSPDPPASGVPVVAVP